MRKHEEICCHDSNTFPFSTPLYFITCLTKLFMLIYINFFLSCLTKYFQEKYLNKFFTALIRGSF
jgi:hypothetical protein